MTSCSLLQNTTFNGTTGIAKSSSNMVDHFKINGAAIEGKGILSWLSMARYHIISLDHLQVAFGVNPWCGRIRERIELIFAALRVGGVHW